MFDSASLVKFKCPTKGIQKYTISTSFSCAFHLFYRSEAAITKLEREAKIYKWSAFVGIGGAMANSLVDDKTCPRFGLLRLKLGT